MLSVGMVVKGRYQVTSLIGHGGMSIVYKAVDRVNGNVLAIKEAKKSGVKNNQAMEQGLVTEGRLLKNLNNPHLPRIYDVIEDKNDIMIIMDFVEGTSLDKVLDQYGAIAPEKVIEWGIQICDVFHYLHTQNPPIIYRDMKPANVILRPDGKIMMIDFGTARTWKFDGSRTSDTMLIGTEGFAAPEQFGGMGQTDARTDIFCLGATMFNLVTNHSPYRKPFGITPLGDWDPKLKDCPLDKIIRKCTERDPYQRYQTARDLQTALIAAQTPGGITRFFTGLLGGNKKVDKGWQSPEMKASSGRSKFLSGFHQQTQVLPEQQVQQPVYQQPVQPQPAFQQPVQPPVNQMPNTPVQDQAGKQGSAQQINRSRLPVKDLHKDNQDTDKQLSNTYRRPIRPRNDERISASTSNQTPLYGQKQAADSQMYANNPGNAYIPPQYVNPQAPDYGYEQPQYVQPQYEQQPQYVEQEPVKPVNYNILMLIAFVIGGMFIIVGALMLIASVPAAAVVLFLLGILGCAAGVILLVLRNK